MTQTSAAPRHAAWIGLGSNLGDRGSYLRGALRALAEAAGVEVVAVSRFHETEPLGPSQGRFLNAAAALSTSLGPRELLELLHAIEARAHRERGPVRWAARTLDLDLLFFDEACVEEPDLVVPHPRLHERSFVLEPLRELAPDLVHPKLGATVTELAERVRDGVKPGEGEEAAWRSRR